MQESLLTFSFSSQNSLKKNSETNRNVHLTWDNQIEREFSVPNCSFFSMFSFDPSQWIPPQVFSQTKWNFIPNQKDSPWINRIINGDSLWGMAALWANGFSHQIQMIYFDPPFGIQFDAEFHVGEIETEGYQDTWQHGLASYLEYLRKRLVLCRELLTSSGSIFVQIGETNLHYVRCIMDEIFGQENFVSQITFRTAISTNNIKGIADYLLWYAADISCIKKKTLFGDRSEDNIDKTFTYSEPDPKTQKTRSFKPQEIVTRLKSGIKTTPNRIYPFIFHGGSFLPPDGFEWKWDAVAMTRLAQLDRLTIINDKLYGKRYLDDFPDMILTNVWNDTSTSTFAARKQYTVKTNPKILRRCIAATTDRGDLVLDPTSGSGTAAIVAEDMERRWIVFDTSPIAILLTASWLLGSLFPCYRYALEGNDFQYKEIPQTSLSDLAHGRSIRKSSRLDQPKIEIDDSRISSPFIIQGIEPFRELVDLEENWIKKLIKLFEINGILTPTHQNIHFNQLKPLKIGKNIEFVIYTANFEEKMYTILFYPLGKFIENLPSRSSLIELSQDLHSNSGFCNRLIICGSNFSPNISFQKDPNNAIILVYYHPDLLIQELNHHHHPEAFHLHGNIELASDGISYNLSYLDPISWELKVIQTMDWAIYGEAELLGILNRTNLNVTRVQMPFYEKFLPKSLFNYLKNSSIHKSQKESCIWGFDKRGFWYLGK